VDLAGLIATWGYAAVFIGTLVEGETVLALAGFAAHRGYLSFPAVVVVALCGSLVGDQLAFAAGRRWGRQLVERWPSLAAGADAAAARLERHATAFVLANRFMYGLRLAGPIAIGMSALSWPRFFVLNVAGAVIWTLAVATIGYAFGELLGRLLDDLRRAEVWVFGIGIVAVLAILAVRHLRHRRR
jgi:membrane protein DedA with SNARE-associated domain